MSFAESPLSPAAAKFAIATALALPLAAAAWILFRPPPEDVPLERLPEPDVFETELEPYDWGRIAAGDWVEHEVATASPLDVSTRVRTRLACVGIEGSTVWVEERDHNVARFFPGASVLCEVERASGRIVRAWWGGPGRTTKPVEVRRVITSAGPPGFERRARVDGATLAVAGLALPCSRALIMERAPGGLWSSRSAVWLAQQIPFPRRATVAAADERVAWEGGRARGGVAREEYSGLTVRMTTEVAAWGKDARRTLQAP
ncbi:MAG: hypothetical protein FD180_1238 [Planctomycetota bacterium]|nr:MAG: hypothetical protein FD180_1238 [Planctomycetota bacterium]